MKSNIVLIGFMGTGKTTVGKILAEKLNKNLVEMDDLIVQKAGKSIADIFSDDGEIVFREYEMAVSKDLSNAQNSIISAGGGVILNKLNVDYLKKNANIILLQATAKDVFERISIEGKEKRPLLNKPDPMGEIKKLLRFRTPFYEAAAEYKISTLKKIPEQIAEEIIAILINDSKGTDSQGDLKDMFKKFGDVFDSQETQNETLIEKSEKSILLYLLEECTKYQGLNPLDLINLIYQSNNVSFQSVDINGIIPGVLLTVVRNYQNKYGDISIEVKIKNNESKKIKLINIDNMKIAIGIKRGSMIPFGSCGFMGICESVIGVGIATSIILGSTPKTYLLKSIANSATASALNDLIKKNLIKSSDPMQIIESSIISAIKFYVNRFNMKFFE